MAEATVRADGQGVWSHVFSALPESNSKGEKIAYTVVETQVNGYAAPAYSPASAAAGGKITVTNTIAQQAVSKTVNKGLGR